MNNISDHTSEMEVSPVTILPHEIIEQLAELDLELSEGKHLFLRSRGCEWALKNYMFVIWKARFHSLLFR